MVNEEILTLDQIATILKIHIATVQRWARTGQINAIRLGNKSGYRVRRSDFEAFLKARETGRGR